MLVRSRSTQHLQRQCLLRLPLSSFITTRQLKQQRSIQSTSGRLSSRLLLRVQHKAKHEEQLSLNEQQDRLLHLPQLQQKPSNEERKALLQQLMLRLDESFKNHHSSWLPMHQQRGGGRAAKPSLQVPWDPQQQHQRQRRGQHESRLPAVTEPVPASLQLSEAAAPAAAAAPPVRRSEDLSGVECLFVILRLARSRGDWQRALRVFQLLNNFGRIPDNHETADRLAAAAAICNRPEEACAVAESGIFFLSSSVSRSLFFALLEDAIDRQDTQLADRIFTCFRQDWRLPISPASYLLMLRASIDSKLIHLKRCVALYDDALNLGVALPLPAHMLLLELLLTRASAEAFVAVPETPARSTAEEPLPAEAPPEADSSSTDETTEKTAAKDDYTLQECLQMAQRVSVCMREDSAAFFGRPLPPRALLLLAWLSLLQLKYERPGSSVNFSSALSLLLEACLRKCTSTIRDQPWRPPAPLLMLLRQPEKHYPSLSAAQRRELARVGVVRLMLWGYLTFCAERRVVTSFDV
ncbi:hypothetical protein Emed_003214 [Eimeria media]